MGSPLGGYPVTGAQPSPYIINFRIDGSEVASAAGTTDGLDVRGAEFCTISDAGGNDQTVVFNRAFISKPYVTPIAETANGAATLTVTKTGFVLAGLERDDNTTGLANIDWNVTIIGYTEATAVSN
jgi:hypothetical protein